MRNFAKCLLLISLAGYSFWSVTAEAQNPSYDCTKARTPDEIVICSIPQLAELDNLVAAGYAFVKSTKGRQSADEVGIPFWRLRQACASDPNCIRQRQIEAITAYQAAGAPVLLPHRLSPDSSLPQPVAAPNTGSSNSDYIVDGLALGGMVHPGSTIYRAYTCRPSDQFPDFTWCAIKHSMTGKFGPFDSWVTILHSDANTAVFILQDVIPAYFSRGDTEREIQRLSQHFGQAARVFTGDPRADAPHSEIAAWGDVTLTALDESTMDALRRGETITAGLLIDFLGDAKKSAREGLPVFHLGGGAGYLWAAKFDDTGKGQLRITAVNPSLLPGGSVERVPAIISQYAPAVALVPAPGNPDSAKIEKDRAERADRVIAAAKQQLDDAAAFIKEHPHSPNLLDYVGRIAALSASVRNGDPDEIERKSTDLANVFSHDKDYQQHLADLADAQKKREAQFLLDAIHRGQKERDFILDFIGKNPLADATPALAALVKQLNPALQRADLNQLQPLVDKIDLAIREANLESGFIAAQKEVYNSSEKKSDMTVGTTEKVVTAHKLPTTEKNRFLVEGDLDDVEILYNANSKAPHVAQNLRGDFVFSQNQARVCLFGQSPDGLALTVKQVVLDKAIPRQIAVTVEPCDPELLLNYDMVAAQRNAFLRSKRDDALALIKTIEDDDYRKFADVTAADLSKAADAERTQIEKIKTNVADGTPDGFGIVLLKTQSANLCVAVGTKVSSHRQLLLRAEDKLNLEMQTEVVVKDTTVDDAFINIQKRQCGAVYASAADLKALNTALTRNDIPYAFSSLWVLPTDVEREDAALAEKARVVAQEETERAQRNADRSRLASVRAEDLSATQAAQQAALRQKFGENAKAAAAALGSEIISWTKDQSGHIAGFYPAYAAWLTDKLADHWEIMTIDSQVQDFGLSAFKGRGLDTVFARVTIHLKNRMLGEYQDPCFIFGRVNDTDFSMSREPVFAECDDEAAIMTWQAGHEFKSEWLASN
jgi:uncharacterized protein/mevalonate kinase